MSTPSSSQRIANALRTAGQNTTSVVRSAGRTVAIVATTTGQATSQALQTTRGEIINTFMMASHPDVAQGLENTANAVQLAATTFLAVEGITRLRRNTQLTEEERLNDIITNRIRANGYQGIITDEMRLEARRALRREQREESWCPCCTIM